MTLKELLQKVDIDRVLPVIADWYYNDEQEFTQEEGYREAYDELVSLSVETVSDDDEESPGRNTREIWIRKSSDPDNDLPFASYLEGEIRSMALGKEIVFKDEFQLTDEELAAVCLWHITFYGYTQKELDLFARKLKKQRENGVLYSMDSETWESEEIIRYVDKEELKKWADKTVKAYASIAEETDMAFYTQSDLTNLYRTPEVMVVGINPGSEGTYKGQKENPNWGLDGKNMTGEQLLKGNYCKEDNGKTSWENRAKWGYWSRLKNYFVNINNGNFLNDDSRFVLTNMSFLNTKKANQLSDILFVETFMHTVNLINVVKPKCIIFLSGKATFEKLQKTGKVNEDFLLEYREIAHGIYIGEMEGIPCLGVPHPSAHLTIVDRKRVVDVITSFMNLQDVDEDYIKEESLGYIKPIDFHSIKKEVVKRLKNDGFKEFDNDEKRFVLSNDLQVTIASGYVAIRHQDFKPHSYDYDGDDYSDLKDILVKLGYTRNNKEDKVWLGKKTFKKYGSENEDIIKGIIDNITELTVYLKKFES